ncbi:MAG: hypothetical protein QOH87_2381, partial [Trebonia sp.]|nr:hypothetical protein [Trebonia sp.]
MQQNEREATVTLAGNALAGKGVVITGAAAGIGRATALYLAAEGVRVVVSDIAEDAGAGVVEEIRGSGGTAEFV